jgi:hypothetical protein
MEIQSLPELERTTVALRMIGFEARTRTIRLSTRLTDDQIRRLYRQYCRARPSSTTSRHRGRSPTQALQFTRNAGTLLESSILAGVLTAHGLLKGLRPKPWLANSLQYARRFCEAYATYLDLAERDPLSFEQAWYFARMLAARSELFLQRCKHCGSHYLGDTHTVLKRDCPICKLREKIAKEAGDVVTITAMRESRSKRRR